MRLNEEFENANLNFLMEANQNSVILSNKLMVDKTGQTPVHFVDRYVDRNHCFSEWELRKNAIQMANIRNKLTKASQTLQSNFKVDSETQVWLSKEKSTNTGVNTGVNPLRPRNYVIGLRTKAT